MKKLIDEEMAKHTTFKIGGPVDLMLVPESEEEVIEAVKYCHKNRTKIRILGNGSNVLVDDKGLEGCVLNMTRACNHLDYKDGLIFAGASVKIQEFIRFCVNKGVRGCEYLYSVPATVGGAIAMNAGRGALYNKQISDDLLTVRVFDGEKIFEVSKDECEFSYRNSIFQKNVHWIILGAVFKPLPQSTEEGQIKVRERMDFIKKNQDHKFASAGSIFKKSRHRIFMILRGLRWGAAGYSAKAPNWINNIDGKAKARDVFMLIKLTKLLNLLTFRKAKLEVKVWKDK